jgi:HemY protein
MKIALWLIGLFAVAVASSLFLGGNHGLVSVFWAPTRVDMSLNFVILVWIFSLILFHAALRTVSLLFDIPAQAKRWRWQMRERALLSGMVQALTQLQSGRFLRAQKSALQTLALHKGMKDSAQHWGLSTPMLVQLQALLHLICAQAAHALNNTEVRESQLQLFLQEGRVLQEQFSNSETLEAAQLLAARWSLDDHDPSAALGWLDQMGAGVARRTMALRMRLKASRILGQYSLALETARLLAKHRAFSPLAAQSLLLSLIASSFKACLEKDQVIKVWSALDPTEKDNPQVALQACERGLALGLSGPVVLHWIKPIWLKLQKNLNTLNLEERTLLVKLTQSALESFKPDPEWLSFMDQIIQSHPGVVEVSYLYGQLCKHHALWGKAQQLLESCAARLQSSELKRQAYAAIAELAQDRMDEASALKAWRQAALMR